MLKIGFFLVGIAIGCTSFEDSNDDEIIDQTIDSLFSYLPEVLAKKNQIVLLHKERYPNKLKRLSLEYILESKDFEDRRDLLKELLLHVNDSVRYFFNTRRYPNGILIDEYSAVIKTKVDYSAYSGIISLSNSVRKNKEGCYLFSIDCGNGCSFGSLVTVYNHDNYWKIKKVSVLWGG
jgi:hypothetical protein